MKIKLDKPDVPTSNHVIVDNSLDIVDGGMLYLNFNEAAKMRVRGNRELVLRNGWICLDQDDEGYICGIEIVSGDPYASKEAVMFQPGLKR